MRTISLDLVREPFVDADNQPCTRAWVQATMLGRKLGGSGAPVAFWDLLAYRGLDCELSLLTCSCGVAACAGYHDDVYQRCLGKHTEWLFNAQEYPMLGAFNPDEERPSHVCVRLDTASLNAALDALLTQICSALDEGPLYLVPGCDDEPLLTQHDLLDSIAQSRKWMLDKKAREALERASFGGLYDLAVQARFANDATMQASLKTLLIVSLGEQAKTEGLDEDAHEAYALQQVKEHWLPLFQREGVKPVLGFVHAQPWRLVGPWFYRCKDGRVGGTLQSAQTRWRNAALSAVRQNR